MLLEIVTALLNSEIFSAQNVACLTCAALFIIQQRSGLVFDNQDIISLFLRNKLHEHSSVENDNLLENYFCDRRKLLGETVVILLPKNLNHQITEYLSRIY